MKGVEVLFDYSGKIVDSINQMAARAVYVGIPAASERPKSEDKEGSKSNKSPPTNAQIGAIQEYGDPKKNIPPRPFLNPAAKTEEQYVAKIIRETSVRTIGVGGDVDTALKFIGIKVAERAKMNIKESVNMQDLSEKTLKQREKKKHGTKPLIDFGYMINSIHYEVGDNGKN